jgi:hypothetical protein
MRLPASRITAMSKALFVTRRRRPTIGALYASAVGLLAVLLLALAETGLVDPIAVAVVAVPLGPIGIVVAALALPVLSGPASPALAGIVLAVVLAVAALNVMIGATIASIASRRLDRIAEHALVR